MLEPRWQREGEEPDYRFSLANERTFLAWIRTALALLAGGILLEQLAIRLGPRHVVVAAAVALAAIAAAVCGAAYLRWRSNEIAMRHHRRLGGSLVIPLMASVLLGVAVFFAVLLFRQ